MAAALRLDWDEEEDPAEGRRRHLLSISDGLLDEVEEIRLRDGRTLPPFLRESIRGFQTELGRPPQVPGTARAAHDLILSLQGRLLAANPRHLTPLSHHGRGGGQPAMTVVGGSLWKVLTLPPHLAHQTQAQWLELVAATVERACDRWRWALHQARAAAAERNCGPEWASACAAWANYWDLTLEAERIRARVAAESRTDELALSA